MTKKIAVLILLFAIAGINCGDDKLAYQKGRKVITKAKSLDDIGRVVFYALQDHDFEKMKPYIYQLSDYETINYPYDEGDEKLHKKLIAHYKKAFFTIFEESKLIGIDFKKCQFDSVEEIDVEGTISFTEYRAFLIIRCFHIKHKIFIKTIFTADEIKEKRGYILSSSLSDFSTYFRKGELLKWGGEIID